MPKRIVITSFAAIWLIAPLPAHSEECPSYDFDNIQKSLAGASSCDKAMAMFKLCEYGASGDVGLGESVIKKCEGEFIAALNKTEQRTYDNKIKACWRKYAKESGTMYRSFEAFCAAGVAQTYARRAKLRRL
jgi:hypothetical protein